MTDPKDDNQHSFLVRIRRQPHEDEIDAPHWRGMIEHLQSGERRYFTTLDRVISFIDPYLGAWGARRQRDRRDDS